MTVFNVSYYFFIPRYKLKDCNLLAKVWDSIPSHTSDIKTEVAYLALIKSKFQ